MEKLKIGLLSENPSLCAIFYSIAKINGMQLSVASSLESGSSFFSTLDGVFVDPELSKEIKNPASSVICLKEPVSEEEIHLLLKKLIQVKNLSPRMLQLKEEYKSTIPDKLFNLKELIQAVTTNPNVDNLKSLRMAVHKLAGNAGTYGYLNVSDLCKNFEKELLQKIEKIQNNPFNLNEIENLNNYYEKIKQGFLDDRYN